MSKTHRKETLAQAWMREHPDDTPCPKPENGLAAAGWRLKRGLGGSARWAAFKRAQHKAEAERRKDGS